MVTMGSSANNVVGEYNCLKFTAGQGGADRKGLADSGWHVDNARSFSRVGDYDVIVAPGEAVKSDAPQLYGVLWKRIIENADTVGVERRVELVAAGDAAAAEKTLLDGAGTGTGRKAEAVLSFPVRSVDGYAVSLRKAVTAASRSDVRATPCRGHLTMTCDTTSFATEDASKFRLYSVPFHQGTGNGEGYCVVFCLAYSPEADKSGKAAMAFFKEHTHTRVIGSAWKAVPVDLPAGFDLVIARECDAPVTGGVGKTLYAALLGAKTGQGIGHWLEYVAAGDGQEAMRSAEGIAKSYGRARAFVELVHPISTVNGFQIKLTSKK
jgi:hypothetical protein